jgi:hypothetical protein
MSFEFQNPDVKAKYTPARETDGKVHIPAGKKNAKNPTPEGYAGPLSLISLVAADKAYASGSNILKLKEPAKAATPAAKANGQLAGDTGKKD